MQTLSPGTRWWARVAALVGIATLIGLFFATRTYLLYNSYPDNSISWADAMWPALLDWYLWALLVPVIAWLVGRFPIERDRWRRGVAVHGVAGTAVVLVRIALDLFVARPLIGLDPMPLGRAVVFGFHPNLMTYFVLVGLFHAVVYYRKYRERELRASQLETRLAQAQLHALKTQLHPHFLFNTLHAIGTLMHRDVDAAERMLTLLADLLRATIEHLGVHEVPLREELAFLDRYLEIEQTRFADRLSVETSIDPLALDVRVPYLLLQPLVENAIRHGIAPRAGPGKITITVTRANGVVELVVRDDGLGLSADDSVREGVGMSNTRARLEQLYGDAYRFDLHEVPGGGVEVKVHVPVRREAGEGGD